MSSGLETYVEPSLFPELVPDRPLGEYPFDEPDAFSVELLESLGKLGINISGEFTTYYGRIKVHSEGLLDEGWREGDAVVATPSHFDYRDIEYWHFHDKGGYNSDAEGYIESLSLLKIHGRFEPVLRTTSQITDMGIGDDHLVLAKNIQSIDTLAPWVSEALVAVENILAGRSDPSYYPEITQDIAYEWDEAISEYLSDDPDFRTIWTPKDGALSAWQ